MNYLDYFAYFLLVCALAEESRKTARARAIAEFSERMNDRLPPLQKD